MYNNLVNFSPVIECSCWTYVAKHKNIQETGCAVFNRQTLEPT